MNSKTNRRNPCASNSRQPRDPGLHHPRSAQERFQSFWLYSKHLLLFHVLRLAHARDKGAAEQEFFMPGGLVRNGSQFIEARLARFGIALFEAFFVQDRLLLHELNVERASSSRVAIEQIVAGLLRNYLVQGIDQFHGIMNAAIQSQTTDGIIDVR